MKHSHAVLLVLLLAQVAISPKTFAQRTDSAVDALLQDRRQEQVRGVALEQNYPNPFSDETRIPFVLGPDLFKDGRSVVVTVRVFNLLHQLIAYPIVLDHPFRRGEPAIELTYERPGRYELLWDGRDTSGEPVASGVYFCQIVADGARSVRKMIVTR